MAITEHPTRSASAPSPSAPEELGLEQVLYAKDAATGVATVTINRPEKLNCFEFQTLQELGRAFQDASWDDAVSVVVVTGAGDRAFCTGADLDEQARMGANSGQYWRWMGAFVEMHDRLRNIGKPTIARINGAAVGGGQELQLACDFGVIADDAYLQHVGPEHGSVPAGGATQWLPLVIGDRRAREMVLLCERISPSQALDWGLVTRIVPRIQLDDAVAELAGKLRHKLPETVRYTKTQLNWWRDLVWSQTVTHARDWLAVHSTSEETREAVAAFHAKREPDYEAMRRYSSAIGKTCPSCGETGIPERFDFCGMCGAALTALQEGVP